MDFEKILNQWDGLKAKESEDDSEFNPAEKEEFDYGHVQKGFDRKKLRKMKPQAELDLHGQTVVQAEPVLDQFILESVRQGLAKVQIIHGKGNHSSDEPVLPRMVREYIEKSPHCGEFGHAQGSEGGKGAVWVILRQRSL